MASSKLRDRDAIVVKEGLIFRVLGYSHPTNACICDIEYAPSTIFKSDDPRAIRTLGQKVFYKFYNDEGWRFLRKSLPKYMLLHEMLRKKTMGAKSRDFHEIRKPETALNQMVKTEPKDDLHRALQNVVDIISDQSGLPKDSFGVFGSLLHGFYHPKFSDIDLTIYGKANVETLTKTLGELHKAKSSLFNNEFGTERSLESKVWRFQNFTLKDFVWHQKRKQIYSLFNCKESRRIIKTEFEPVKAWNEIRNEYNPEVKIRQRGWVKMLARVEDDVGAPFIPSVYAIEPLKIIKGEMNSKHAEHIVSYMEEFRMQAFRDETVYVEGNLEEVIAKNEASYQVTLTYCPRYYEQVLKATNIQNV